MNIGTTPLEKGIHIMELYIVRHGETIWNKEKRLQGSTDIELGPEGIRLAKETGEALMGTKIDLIYSSPLKRAFETANLIRNGRDIPLIPDDRIRELNFGISEGQRYEDLYADKDSYFKYFFDQPQLYKPSENGETLDHLVERASDFMQEVIEPLEGDCERVMIVAHGAMNKAIMTYIKGHSLEHFWSGGLQRNCNVIIVELNKGKYNIIDETKVFYTE